jgi:hypothetical protein
VTYHIRNPRRVQIWSGGPIPDDAHHRDAADMRPTPAGGPARQQNLRLMLIRLYLYGGARMVGDVVNERCFMAELERLAERPKPRAAEGDRFDTVGGEHDSIRD